MVLGIVIAALMWMGLIACGLASTIELWRVVDEVNATRPADRRFNHIGWHFVKHWDFREAYERLGRGRYPPRRLLRLWVGMGLFFAGMVLALALLLAR